ncbi:beta-alanyl-dopamine/carcinine hydrolase-like [Ylistrum balloti]|uniref:beta-alanyl-dopamine/carcinine hydrolase-like n=1 Tax=Ylistrum balloti TaxID=509963 RepID=UPI002905C02F|nr:beta-alanyl-dopamine/carcinine hydrolase-like [Ylistrum balloti]XP_060066550.1 beta-alanyl-dopamine/carcinine hydrolase-like [Ylistrum balloti]
MASSSAVSLPILHVRGNYYDVGYHTGSTFQNRIKSFYQRSLLVQEKLLPFYSQRRGREIAEVYLRGARDNFPKLIREIQGLADGVGMSFEDIFILNIAKEVYNCHFNEMKSWPPESDNLGCSDIMVNTPAVKLIAHNEDCDPESKNFGFMVSAHIIEDSTEEKFTAFSYPGSLPGNTFAFNKHGMIFACNGLYPKTALLGATPRYFLNRCMMAATTADHALEIGKNVGGGCAVGFNLNIGNWKNPQDMWGLEIGPGKNESMVHLHTFHEQTNECDSPSYVHTNNYKHLHVEEMDNLSSTIARMKRILEFKAPSTAQEVKTILGDTQNAEYPIYRTPSATDIGKTVATALFDLKERQMELYLDNPKFAQSPVFALPLV